MVFVNHDNTCWKYYADDDHGSVPLISEYDALREMFSWYRIKNLGQYFSPDADFEPQEIIDLFVTHYQKVSEHFGYEVLPAEQEINQFGYNFMQMKPEVSRAFFELNIKNYPDSPNVYDSMGDFYSAHGENDKAIEMFEMAVEIGDYQVSKDKLDQLRAKE